MKVLFVVAAAAMLGAAMAACPNHCSGHGTCIADDKCSCFIRYTGSDCSQRKCKEHLAWADGDNTNTHDYAECSNKGVCDRATGECACYPGYEGAACQRSECPNDCSGHGTCEYLNDLSGGYSGTFWDLNKIQGCKCDPWYEGYDCSQRQCPRGDDPLTPCPAPGAGSGQCDGQVWTVTYVADTGTIAKKSVHWLVQDLYGEWYTSRSFLMGDPEPHSSSPTADDLSAAEEAQARAALEDMDWWVSFADSTPFVFTSADDADTQADDTVITFKMKNPKRITTVTIIRDACKVGGCYPLKATPTDSDEVADAVGLTITTTETSLTSGASDYLFDDAESAVCSNRGICDHDSGKCQCFEGHTGVACEDQTILV